jgi:hypothetical protein
LIFIFQLVDQKRDTAYQGIRSEVKEIADVMYDYENTSGGSIKTMRAIVIEVIDFIEPLDLRMIIGARGELEDKISAAATNLEQDRSRMTEKQKACRRRIVLLLENIRGRISMFQLLDIVMEITRYLTHTCLLGISILLLLAFKMEIIGWFPDLNIPIAFGIATWFIIAMLELVTHTLDLFRRVRQGF